MLSLPRLTGPGALLSTGALLLAGLPAGAAAAPTPNAEPLPPAQSTTWSTPQSSVRTPADEVVAAGATQPGARTAAGRMRVVSVRAVDGRPVASSTVVSGPAAAEQEVTRRQQEPGVLAVEIDVPRELATVPAQTAATATDPYRKEQWGMDVLGAEQVWPKSNGAGVLIAVIDTGVDATHPDLAGRVLPGAAFPADGRPGTSPVDPHGTHVAGIAAAAANNGRGIAGVAPGARILPVRAFDSEGRALTESLVGGIVYAADNGADVINMSYTEMQPSQAEQTALNYARSKGAVLLAAGGNDPALSPVYPAALPGVIAVSNLQSNGRVNPATSSGSFMDVTAPGTDILSTVPGGYYDLMTGTSMATPAAAGVAALLLGAYPSLTPEQVEQSLTSTATDLETPGFDILSGYGRVAVPDALRKAECFASGSCRTAVNPLTDNKNQAVVSRAHVTVLKRQASGNELVTWDTRLRAGSTPADLSNALTGSDEFRRSFIIDAYRRYLNRTPSNSEVESWLTRMRAGTTQPRVEASFLGSAEFYRAGGGTSSAYVTRLYRTVLGRTPSAAEAKGWTDALARGASRTTVAYGFTSSREYQSKRVDAWYAVLLGRAPTAAERKAATDRILAGGRIEQVIAGVVNGYEFRALSGRPFGPDGKPPLRGSN